MEETTNRFARLKDAKIPLLVKIQSIEVENLDIRSFSKVKHVTCVEGTNKYIIVGCTSGTVYLFSRDKLQFLSIIPFKGGKVCCISCPEDEADIAIGSIRGKVSIYRICSSEGPFVGEGTSVPKLSVQHLCSINHHVNNEITEMQWSPNGRYLFVGDSQGIISQVDVGGLDEFPRPLLSRVILQVGSRVLQIDCIFPYIAVNALTCVFLCDIENENFTRIRNPTKDSFQRAAGICLAASQQIRTQLNTSVVLYLGALNSSTIFRYASDGTFIDSYDVSSSILCRNETRIFDPKCDTGTYYDNGYSPETKISLGKLISCDDECLISATSNQIVVIEPLAVCAVAWSDEFRRISSLKVVSNYIFIWETGKLHVVASTTFRSYAHQLLQAKLAPLLNSWIIHSLNAVGYRQYFDDRAVETMESIRNLDDLVQAIIIVFEGYQDLLEDDELFRLIFTHMHPDLAQRVKDAVFHFPLSLEQEDEADFQPEEVEQRFPPFRARLLQFLNEVIGIASICDDTDADENYICTLLFESLTSLYEDVDVDLNPKKDGTEDVVIIKEKPKSESNGIDNLTQRIQDFLQQNCFRLFQEEVEFESLSCWSERFYQAVDTLLAFLRRKACPALSTSCVQSLSARLSRYNFFTSLGVSSNIQKWFQDWKFLVSLNDAVLADLFLMLSPFCWRLSSKDYQDLTRWNHERFFLWLAVLSVSTVKKCFPYSSPTLASLFHIGMKGVTLDEIVAAVYSENSGRDTGSVLFNFISLFNLNMKKNANRKKMLMTLVTTVPCKDADDAEIRSKIINACRSRREIFAMYYRACLLGGKTVTLCACGLPSFRGYPSTFLTPRMQQLVEESLLEVMFYSKLAGIRDKAFKFAMERLLLQRYFSLVEATNPTKEDDILRFEIVLRSGKNSLLQDGLAFTEKRLQLFLDYYSSTVSEKLLENCRFCHQPLKPYPNFRLIPWDCVGLWMANADNNYGVLANALQRFPVLNSPGLFSLRFYQVLISGGSCTPGQYNDLEDLTDGYSAENVALKPSPEFEKLIMP